MNIPKRNHYLPQFYLESFTNDNDLLWIFDRKKKEYRQQSPKNTAVLGYYYIFKGKDEKKHKEIEEFFSVIEGKTKLILNKLDKKESINAEEREILAAFISFQKTRVPEFEKWINESYEKMTKRMSQLIFSSEERVLAMIDRYEKETGKKIKMYPKELIDFVQEDRYFVKFPREYSMKAMLEFGLGFIMYFLQMDWFFLWAPKNNSFITSDNPFLLLPPKDYNPRSFYGVGILTPGAKKIIPLTAHTCLIIGDYGGKMIDQLADQKAIRAINLNSAVNSDRFLIARAKPLLERIVQITKVDKLEKKERIKIS